MSEGKCFECVNLTSLSKQEAKDGTKCRCTKYDEEIEVDTEVTSECSSFVSKTYNRRKI